MGCFFCLLLIARKGFKLNIGILGANLPFQSLNLKRCQLLLHTGTTVHYKAYFSFHSRNFTTGLIQQALRFAHLLPRYKMRLSNSFQFSLFMAQIRNMAFKRKRGCSTFCLDACLLSQAFKLPHKPQLVLFQGATGLQCVVAQSHFGLLFKPLKLGIEFAQDVINAGQVIQRIA